MTAPSHERLTEVTGEIVQASVEVLRAVVPIEKQGPIEELRRDFLEAAEYMRQALFNLELMM